MASSNELAGGWIRRAARVMVEQMLSAEVDEALGRGSYPIVRHLPPLLREQDCVAGTDQSDAGRAQKRW